MAACLRSLQRLLVLPLVVQLALQSCQQRRVEAWIVPPSKALSSTSSQPVAQHGSSRCSSNGISSSISSIRGKDTGVTGWTLQASSALGEVEAAAAAGGQRGGTTLDRARDETHDTQSPDARGVEAEEPVQKQAVQLYDTTLRDGTQMEGISVSVDDKLKIAHKLGDFGMAYIEGGWPGSNPKDVEFFRRAKEELSPSAWASVVAFGSTRRKRSEAATDQQLIKLLEADTNTVCIVGKAWDLHVDKILEVPREENLAMIRDSVGYLKGEGREVMIDLEHFFDGFKANEQYTLECCQAAVDGGVDVLVLCDTNGGSLPWEIGSIVEQVALACPGTRLGIHCHNDQDLAVCNSIQAVRSGCTVVQGTVNGIGERTGNANLMSIAPTLQLKMGLDVVGDNLRNITALSRFTDEQLNRASELKAPFVGASAFAHKGGIHVSAVNKVPDSYQHIDPSVVGNTRRTLVSELSGRSNIVSKMEEFGMATPSEIKSSVIWNERVSTILSHVKALENNGFTFEGADASVNLMIRRTMPGYSAPFVVLDYQVYMGKDFSDAVTMTSEGGTISPRSARATVKVLLPEEGGGVLKGDGGGAVGGRGAAGGDAIELEVAEGNGPVNALATALYKGLKSRFPSLHDISLIDYKVRILDQDNATAAKTRVMIEFRDHVHRATWTTVGVDSNVISASMRALLDGFEFALVEYAPSCALDAPTHSQY